MSDNARTQGITIVEVLVALAILGIALTTLLSAMISNTRLNTQVDQRSEAIRISEDTLEAYRQAGNYGVLATSAPRTSTVTRRNQPYTVVATFCPSDKPVRMICSNTAVYIRVEVNSGSKMLHKAETYYTTFGREN